MSRSLTNRDQGDTGPPVSPATPWKSRQLVLFELIGDEIKLWYADDPWTAHSNDGRMEPEADGVWCIHGEAELSSPPFRFAVDPCSECGYVPD